MISGTIYGAILNDREQHKLLADAFREPPYKAPPRRPVLYIKTRNCLVTDEGCVRLPPDLIRVEAAATLGLLFNRDARRVTAGAALGYIGGACLALDISEPQESYYRPAVRQRCRDGFLPLGNLAEFSPALLNGDIETRVDGKMAHVWSPKRLVRDAATLIADVSAFMTLAAGDLLLIGLSNDAPKLASGNHITVSAPGFPDLSAQLHGEMAA
jgi:5-oxopent-3-ene-1,2,5-tricarboxylate decarboxylase / 2-hydroxyhepta-2,4-diene-1,7-dioate isomerase